MARRKKFRAWGLALLLAAVVSALDDQWLACVCFGIALVLYLLAVRRTRCRVETREGRPCSFSARGYLGSCKLHAGLKRGLPVIARSGAFGLPGLMWSRPDLPAVPRLTPQPVSALREVGTTELPDRDGRENAMLWVAVASAVIAFAAFLRDLVAG